MSVGTSKPKTLKYTDMAIYIDENLEKIKISNANPDVEETIYKYLYFICMALSRKMNFFRNSNDHEQFSRYAAAELYLSMQRKLQNSGKIIHGKEVKPVKSSLNFIKATLYPLKINYQQSTFNCVLKYDSMKCADRYKNNLEQEIQKEYRPKTHEIYLEMVHQLPEYVENILKNCPFGHDPLMKQKLRISILLTFLSDITIPNKTRLKIDKKLEVDSNSQLQEKLFSAYKKENSDVLLWHLDPCYKNYIRLLTIRLKKLIGKELSLYFHANDLSEDLLSSVMKGDNKDYLAAYEEID